MATLYISPTGGGLRDGSSILNAGALIDLSTFIGAAGPDGEVLLIADHGTYDSKTLTIVSGGTPGHPVTIRGVDSEGNPAKAVIVGHRADPYVPNSGPGEEVFRLLDGADNIRISDLSFKNIGYAAIRVGSDIENLTIENVDAQNVQRFLENYATSDSVTATIAGLTVRNIQVDGFSKGAIRLQYDSHNVLIEDVRGDSQRQDGENFAIGVHLGGTVHDVVIQRSVMRNAYDSVSGVYWNGDGFATERDVYNVLFQDTVATGNTDGGYDLKSTDTTLIRPIAEGNKRNFRLWGEENVLIKDAVSLDPVTYGEKANPQHFGFTRGAKVTIENPFLSDAGEFTTAFDAGEGSALVIVTGPAVGISPDAMLVKRGRGSTVTISDTDGALVISGESTFDGSAATQPLYVRADDAAQTLIGGNAGDILQGMDGNDVLIGGISADVLVGGTGDDVLAGGEGADVLLGGTGFDQVDYSSATSGVDVDLVAGAPGRAAAGDLLEGIEGLVGSAYADALHGDAGRNLFAGGGGDDVLDGRGGDDILAGGAGGDTLVGGTGIDTASYADSAAAVVVNIDTGTGLGGDAQGDTLSGIERVIGSIYADILGGGTSNDFLVGGAGEDMLSGGAGFDTADYSGSQGAVTINLMMGTGVGGDAEGDSLSSIERIVGSIFADMLIGDNLGNVFQSGAGNDWLEGGAANDVLDGGAGSDTLIGGAGFDTADYSGSQGAVTINLMAGTGAGGDAEGDTLSGIERIVGTAFTDALRGGSDADVLASGDGDDLLVGGAGADTIIGGRGIDTASYATSTEGVVLNLTNGKGEGDAAGDVLAEIEIVVGSAFADVLTLGSVGLTLDGADGDDRLTGGVSDDVLVGGAGADMIAGGAGFDTADYSASVAGVIVVLSGGPGIGGDAQGDRLTEVERLVGSRFADSLRGDEHDNVFVGGAGEDLLIGGGGLDTVDYSNNWAAVTIEVAAGTALGGDAEGDTLSGIGRIIGTTFADQLTGGSGDEQFVGGGGGDRIQGGDGRDRVDYSGSAVSVRINLVAGTGLGGDAEGDTFSGIEDVVGTSDDDVLIGNDVANLLVGGDGNDTLNDGAGDDILVGGAGDDLYTVDSTGDVVVEEPGEGTDRVSTSLSAYTLGEGVEQLAYTGTGAFTGLGNALDNTFLGSAGNETIYGLDGDDKFQGSVGADTFYGGSGSNYADYSKAKASIVVNLTTNQNFHDMAEGDLLYDVNSLAGSNYTDVLSGDDGANTIWGRNGADNLYGLDGKDLLDGGAGTDRMEGGADDDTYVVDNPGDLTIERTDNGNDTVRTTLTGLTLVENIENLVYSGTRGFVGNGNALDNTLIGGAGKDTLVGGNGNDVLIGRNGADRLDGGAGIDTASYADSTVGVIADFLIGTGSAGEAQGDTYIGIENLMGSSKADRLTGDGVNNRLEGRDGNDDLDGSAGNDLLVGGGGGDRIHGGDGFDTVAFGGELLDYAFFLADGAIVLTDLRIDAPDGVDTVSSVEAFQFADDMIGWDALFARILANAPRDLVLVGAIMAENAATGTIVGTASAYDDPGDTLRYALLDDSDGQFIIDAATGVLYVAPGATLDHESADVREVTVVVADALGLTDMRTFAIAVTNVNEAPTTLTLTNGTIRPSAAAGTLVGIAVGSDPDLADTLTYALIDDAGGRFAIDATSGALRVAAGARIDAAGYAVVVGVTDVAGARFAAGFDIGVVDPYRGDKPDVLSNTFLVDTRPGGATGTVAINNFGNKDVLVTTKVIVDSNNDGIIQFGRSILNATPTTQISFTTPTDGKVTSLELDGAITFDGVNYFVYSRVGSAAGTADLHLLDYSHLQSDVVGERFAHWYTSAGIDFLV